MGTSEPVQADELDITDDLTLWKSKGNSTLPGIPWVEQIEDTPETHLGSPGFGDMFTGRSLISTPTGDKIAPNKTDQAGLFIREQIRSDTHAWFRKCLVLQRTARGIPAVFPTALSAALATPKTERVLDRNNWRRGMVAFSYDPKIPGTAGHVFFIVGRLDGQIITGTNDAKSPGAVDFVPLSFYEDVWGHKIQFAATMLNGYDFSDFNKPPVQVLEGTLGDNYTKSIDILKKIRAQKREKLGADHPLVLALDNDISRMTKHLNAWKRS